MRTRKTCRGFTLLEMSIVLVLIGVIIGMGLVTFTASLQASQFNTTVARMDAIDKALLNYAVANSRIPCPSDLLQTPSSATYGLEAGAGTGSSPGTATGACTGTSMVPQATFKATSGTVEGGVPTRALKLTDDYMYDGWGHRFRYAVDPTRTVANALPVAAGPVCIPDPGAITVNDATEAARTTTAAYALVSQGANGHGAYTSNGTTVNACSVNTDELTNCHCSSAGAYSGTYTPTYVQKVPLQNSTNALNDFDDIVSFKEPWQLQTQNFPLGSAYQCIYVSGNDGNLYVYDSITYNLLSTYNISNAGELALDKSGNIWLSSWGNNDVWKYNSSGVLQSTTVDNCDPTGLTFDSSNNLWLAANCNNRVEEYNSSTGAFIKAFGAYRVWGSGIGSFNSVYDVKIDGSGNFWVADAGNNRIVELNSSGTYVQEFGGGGLSTGTCPAANNCVACTNTSSAANCAATAECSTPCTSTVACYCPGGSGNGQLSSPIAIAIDTTGNIWVSDQGNSRIVEFSNTGTYMQTVGSGDFGDSTQISFDAGGNLWTSDRWSSVALKFNSSGTLVNQLNTPGSAGSAIGSR